MKNSQWTSLTYQKFVSKVPYYYVQGVRWNLVYHQSWLWLVEKRLGPVCMCWSLKVPCGTHFQIFTINSRIQTLQTFWKMRQAKLAQGGHFFFYSFFSSSSMRQILLLENIGHNMGSLTMTLCACVFLPTTNACTHIRNCCKRSFPLPLTLTAVSTPAVASRWMRPSGLCWKSKL